MLVALSRRNLEALLAKLDANKEQALTSFCTIIKPDGTIVRAEENEVHYHDRPAGPMHPREEARISKPEQGVYPA